MYNFNPDALKQSIMNSVIGSINAILPPSGMVAYPADNCNIEINYNLSDDGKKLRIKIDIIDE